VAQSKIAGGYFTAEHSRKRMPVHSYQTEIDVPQDDGDKSKGAQIMQDSY